MAVFQTVFFDTLPAIGTCIPVPFGGFITSQMNIFGGEQFADFIEYILQKVQCMCFAGTEDILCKAVFGNLYGVAEAA